MVSARVSQGAYARENASARLRGSASKGARGSRIRNHSAEQEHLGRHTARCGTSAAVELTLAQTPFDARRARRAGAQAASPRTRHVDVRGHCRRHPRRLTIQSVPPAAAAAKANAVSHWRISSPEVPRHRSTSAPLGTAPLGTVSTVSTTARYALTIDTIDTVPRQGRAVTWTERARCVDTVDTVPCERSGTVSTVSTAQAVTRWTPPLTGLTPSPVDAGGWEMISGTRGRSTERRCTSPSCRDSPRSPRRALRLASR
jgi:hypothetical protein